MPLWPENSMHHPYGLPPSEGDRTSSIAFASAIVVVPLVLNGFYKPILAQMPALFWIVELLTWLVLPAWAFRVFTAPDFSLASIGLNRRLRSTWSPTTMIALTLLIGVACSTLYSLSVALCAAAFPVNYLAVDFDYARLMTKTQPWRLLSAIFYAVTAGVVEEIFFRGLPLLWANRIGGKIRSSYVIWSSALFALAHWEQGIRGIVPALLWGFMMAWLLLFMRNLWPLVTIHTAFDFAIFALDFRPSRLTEVLFGSGTGG